MDPSQVDFGAVPLGKTRTVDLTITSTGAGNAGAGNIAINATGNVSLAGNLSASGGVATAGNPGRVL